MRVSSTAHRSAALFKLDPGWLFLCAGVAVLSAAMVIPAQRDLRAACIERDKARAVEQWQADRLERYSTYLDAAQNPDGRTARWLVATQLNLVPATSVPIATFTDPARADAGVVALADLEPPLVFTPPPTHRISTLERLATGPFRLWVIAGAAVCVLIGLLPAARKALPA